MFKLTRIHNVQKQRIWEDHVRPCVSIQVKRKTWNHELFFPLFPGHGMTRNISPSCFTTPCLISQPATHYVERLRPFSHTWNIKTVRACEGNGSIKYGNIKRKTEIKVKKSSWTLLSKYSISILNCLDFVLCFIILPQQVRPHPHLFMRKQEGRFIYVDNSFLWDLEILEESNKERLGKHEFFPVIHDAMFLSQALGGRMRWESFSCISFNQDRNNVEESGSFSGISFNQDSNNVEVTNHKIWGKIQSE